MKHKVSVNYLFNLMFNVLTLIAPLITTPYISRVLGAEAIGTYSFCFSISTYFVVAGMLGIPTYAKREIAFVREEPYRLNGLFSELFTLQMYTLSLSLILYILFVSLYGKFTYIFFACGLGIFAALFDVSWLLAGLEEFKKIVGRNFLIKLINIFAIFIFVKESEDLYIYAYCIMGANFLGNLWLFAVSFHYVHYRRVDFKRIVRHIKPAVILLLPTMVTTITAVIDKTMLGAMSGNMSEIGFYEQSQKIITLSVTLITSLGAVLMPRFASLYSNRDDSKLIDFVGKGLNAVSFAAMPLAFGIFAVADNLVPWFYGLDFEKVIHLIKIFSPMLVFLGINDLIGIQVLAATKNEIKLLIINIIGTCSNLILNLFLIPQFLCLGAATATVISESVKCFLFLYVGKKYIGNRSYVFGVIKYGCVAGLMAIIMKVCNLGRLRISSLLHTVCLIVIGGISYIIILLAIRDKWCYQMMGKIWFFLRKKNF